MYVLVVFCCSQICSHFCREYHDICQTRLTQMWANILMHWRDMPWRPNQIVRLCPNELQFVFLISMHAGVQGWRCRGKRLTISSRTARYTAVGHCFKDLHRSSYIDTCHYLSLVPGPGQKAPAAKKKQPGEIRMQKARLITPFGCPLTFYHYVKLCRNQYYNNQGVQ